MSGTGLHGIFSVTSPAERRRVVQKLLMGDLADLADDGLHQLLPKLNPQPGANNKWKTTKTHGLHNQATQHQQWPKDLKVPSDTFHIPSIGKNLPRHGSRELCFESLEKKVLHQLQRYNAKGQTVEALRDVVFPELNLRSYLDCKSELDLQTVRQLVQGRPKDEATELEQSLTKAMLRQMRRQIRLNGHPNQKSIMGHPRATSVKDFSLGSVYHKPQQVEWED